MSLIAKQLGMAMRAGHKRSQGARSRKPGWAPMPGRESAGVKKLRA